MSFDDGITAVLFSRTVLTLESCPHGIELVDSCFHEGGIIRQDACLEVACTCALHADAGTGEVCRADVGGLQVEDDDLEMNPRA